MTKLNVAVLTALALMGAVMASAFAVSSAQAVCHPDMPCSEPLHLPVLSATAMPEPTSEPTATPTPVPTTTPKPEAVATATPTATPSPTAIPTPTATATATPEPAVVELDGIALVVASSRILWDAGEAVDYIEECFDKNQWFEDIYAVALGYPALKWLKQRQYPDFTRDDPDFDTPIADTMNQWLNGMRYGGINVCQSLRDAMSAHLLTDGGSEQ